LNLSADVEEMNFLQGKNQAEIANDVGLTRSNITRMLTGTRNAGIIQYKSIATITGREEVKIQEG